MNREKHAAIFTRMLAIREIANARQIRKLFIAEGNAIYEEFLKNGESAVDKIITADEGNLFKLLGGIYKEATHSFADYTLEQLGEKPLQKKGFHFSNFLDITTSFIHTEGLKRSKTIANTTRTIVTRVVKQGQSDGLGQEAIAKNIRDKYQSMSAWRSATIARTETHNAATFGSQAIAEQSDTELIREWVAVDDSRTREWHADANGQQQAMDEPFDVDGEEIDRPGEGSPENSINCRCSLIYIPRY
jgi:SPP1 gp7 family putative phage head morphogenesis protein